MRIEVEAPESHQVLVVVRHDSRWAAQAIDRAHVADRDYGPFTVALRDLDAYLAAPSGERLGRVLP